MINLNESKLVGPINGTDSMVGRRSRSTTKSAATNSRHVDGVTDVISCNVDIGTIFLGWHVPLKFVAFVNEFAVNQRPFVTAHSNHTTAMIGSISVT